MPLTDKLLSVIPAYVAVREAAPTDHLLTYQGATLNYSLVVAHLRRFGQKAAIAPLTCHRLCYTVPTLLVNQGIPIASLQKFLGHQEERKKHLQYRLFPFQSNRGILN